MQVGVVSLIVFGAMLWELRVSRANEQEYRRRGAVEGPDPVYPVMRLAYPGAFLVMAIEGMSRAPLAGWLALAGAALFVVAKLLKVLPLAKQLFGPYKQSLERNGRQDLLNA